MWVPFSLISFWSHGFFSRTKDIYFSLSNVSMKTYNQSKKHKSNQIVTTNLNQNKKRTKKKLKLEANLTQFSLHALGGGTNEVALNGARLSPPTLSFWWLFHVFCSISAGLRSADFSLSLSVSSVPRDLSLVHWAMVDRAPTFESWEFKEAVSSALLAVDRPYLWNTHKNQLSPSIMILRIPIMY